jgi:carboxyl-terminal processing protease
MLHRKVIFACLILFTAIGLLTPPLLAQRSKRTSKKPTVTGKKWSVFVKGIPEKPRSPEKLRRLEAFHKTWETINQSYFDQTFGGLDWNTIYREFLPRVDGTKTDDELHDLLEEMIGRLNKSHFSIIPPQIYQAIELAKTTARQREMDRVAEKEKASGTSGTDEDEDEDAEFDDSARFGIGVEMRLMNEQFWITRVIEGSAAQKAGIKTGFIIEKINDVSLKDLMKEVDTGHARSKSVRKLLAGEIVTWILNGPEGTDVNLVYLNEKDEVKNARIVREKLGGSVVSIGKNYPEQYLSFETRSITDDIGYVKFNLFAMPIVEKFCTALTDFRGKKALIVDLRGNHGGLFAALIGISGMMSDRKLELGTQIYRFGSEKLAAQPMAKNFKGKMVVLVDDLSISSAEVLASALQEDGRALLIGEKTAGEALPAISTELPTGAVLVYPIANLKTGKGKSIEGEGIAPDIAVNLDRGSLLEGRDLQFEAALKAIKDSTPIPAALPPPARATVSIETAGPPSPPPPLRAASPGGQGGGRGTGVGLRAPPAMPAVVIPAGSFTKDERSLQIISEYIKAVGGEEAVRSVESYSIKGVSVMKTRGSEVDATLEIYRRKLDQYSEISSTAVLGELREIYTKDTFTLQTDFGMTTELPVSLPVSRREIFAPIFQLMDKSAFKSLSYSGIFDRAGRKAHVVNGTTADDEHVALAFDVETRLLVGYAGNNFTFSLGEYEKVQGLLLPFSIDRDNVSLTAYEIKINTAIDDSNFRKKVNCFDRPN